MFKIQVQFNNTILNFESTVNSNSDSDHSFVDAGAFSCKKIICPECPEASPSSIPVEVAVGPDEGPAESMVILHYHHRNSFNSRIEVFFVSRNPALFV